MLTKRLRDQCTSTHRGRAGPVRCDSGQCSTRQSVNAVRQMTHGADARALSAPFVFFCTFGSSLWLQSGPSEPSTIIVPPSCYNPNLTQCHGQGNRPNAVKGQPPVAPLRVPSSVSWSDLFNSSACIRCQNKWIQMVCCRAKEGGFGHTDGVFHFVDKTLQFCDLSVFN